FRTALSDLRTSTQWLLDQESYSIDPENVYITGSSAGAEVVLHAPYWDALAMNLDEPHLNDSFAYAGVLAFAGAMVDTSLITSANHVPMMMHHGTCDPLVPYGSAIHHFCPENSVGGLPLHGSKSVMERLNTTGGSYNLVSVCGGKHGQASVPISKNIPEIIAFLDDCVARKSFQIHEVIEGSLDKCKYGKEWSPCN
ncbi:MAG: alpha/beta hydrolase, partial [Flavobacteriales bacterium]